uniref:Carbohydrate sulfotransferase n=1 Tax=Amblyomma maculatum TaxID=34609 RepID=G3MRX9_AMBMU
MDDKQAHASKRTASPASQAVRGFAKAVLFRVATPGPGTLVCLLLVGLVMMLLLTLTPSEFQKTALKIASSWRCEDHGPMAKSRYASLDDNEARRERIRSFCEAHPWWQRLHRPNSGFGVNLPTLRQEKMQCHPLECPLFVDDSRSLAFCFIPKVASTSLKALFAPLLNVTIIGTRSDALHWSFHYQTLRYGPATLLQSSRSNYTKVLFVRHPFERLVSTYIDKALRGRSKMAWAYRNYWDKIPGVRAENRCPTFSEFIDFVLKMPVEHSDEHWAPYYYRCQPCLLDYDFVGKLETASRDFPRFFSLVDIKANETFLGNMSRKNTRDSVRDVRTTESKQYFAELSYDQVMGLYARYFYDFELFGYDFRDYLPSA